MKTCGDKLFRKFSKSDKLNTDFNFCDNFSLLISWISSAHDKKAEISERKMWSETRDRGSFGFVQFLTSVEQRLQILRMNTEMCKNQ